MPALLSPAMQAPHSWKSGGDSSSPNGVHHHLIPITNDNGFHTLKTVHVADSTSKQRRTNRLFFLPVLCPLISILWLASYLTASEVIPSAVRATHNLATEALGSTPAHPAIGIFFLMNQMYSHTYSFAKEVAQLGQYDVHCVVDSNEVMYSEHEESSKLFQHPRLHVIQYDDDFIEQQGYVGMNYGQPPATAWDKVWYANTVDTNYTDKYDYIYIIEEDVFVPSTATIQNFTRSIDQYNTDHGVIVDIVTKAHRTRREDSQWYWWWVHLNHPITQYVNDDSWWSMVCTLALSRNYLQKLHLFHTTVQSIANATNEISLPVVANYYNLTNYVAPNLQHVTYRHDAYFVDTRLNNEWTLADIKIVNDTNLFYHPVKQLELHPVFRAALAEQT